MNLNKKHDIEQLSAAFAEFEDASRSLGAFYQTLEQQVGELTLELANARSAQARELGEKERLAARLSSLLDALPGGVVVIDQHGRVQECNPVAQDLLGAITAGESWQAVVKRAFAPRWDDGHDISLADGRLVNIATQALAGEPGQILLLKDVTETRRLQDQLAHHKRLSAKTEMAAAMAHQIRTPLASALLSIGNLRRAADAATRERGVDRSVKALKKLERLVDEMLLFARGGQLEVEAVSIDSLLAALESAVAESLSFKDFRIEFRRDHGSASVYANQAALISIALNLIENAALARSGPGTIEITSLTTEEALEVRFHDDGPGIAPEQQASIFEPFFTTRSNGTGLGLAVARAVARAHAGDLVLEPDTCGACFVLRLPLIASENGVHTATPVSLTADDDHA